MRRRSGPLSKGQAPGQDTRLRNPIGWRAMDREAIPRVIGIGLFAAALSAAVPARAQQDPNRTWCENKDGTASRAAVDLRLHRADRSRHRGGRERSRDLQQPRHRLPGQGRSRSRHRRLQRGDPARSRLRRRLFQPRPRPTTSSTTSTVPSPTMARACESIRSTARPMSTAASPISPSAIRSARSPITARRSNSIRTTPMPSTCAAWPIA